MIYRWIRYGLLVSCVFASLGIWMVPALALEHGSIVGVKVSPDLRRIVIQSDGPLGQYKAFVIGQPYRLVMDFKDAGLSRGLSRIKFDKKPIREIRLGSTAIRTRVVVDFGQNPAPPYKVRREGGHLVVLLGESLPIPPRAATSGSLKAKAQTPPPKSAPKQARKPEKKQNASLLRIKSAAVVDGLIVVELSKAKDPKRSCKLIMEVDLDRMKLSRAVLNDGEGNIACAEKTSKHASTSADSESVGSVRGPRKAPAETTSLPPRGTHYKWGLPKVETRGPTKSLDRKVGPLRVESFSLRRMAEAQNKH